MCVCAACCIVCVVLGARCTTSISHVAVDGRAWVPVRIANDSDWIVASRVWCCVGPLLQLALLQLALVQLALLKLHCSSTYTTEPAVHILRDMWFRQHRLSGCIFKQQNLDLNKLRL